MATRWLGAQSLCTRHSTPGLRPAILILFARRELCSALNRQRQLQVSTAWSSSRPRPFPESLPTFKPLRSQATQRRFRSPSNSTLEADRQFLIEDDGLVAVAENAPIEVPANRARKYHAFKIAAACNEVLYLVAM